MDTFHLLQAFQRFFHTDTTLVVASPGRINIDDQLASSNKGWPDFVIGVVDQLSKVGIEFGGFDMAITGNVPTGASTQIIYQN